MAVTLHDFRDAFPEFDATESDDLEQAVLDDAVAIHSATEFGTYLAAAHVLSLDKQSQLGGEITTITVGDITKTAARMTTNERDAWLSTTHYGRRLIAREKSRTRPQMFAA